MPDATKRKIAILGGGVGAMTAAFALTERPGWQDDYEVTVYQMGWRLGGKGASGRNLARGARIEEHGLHVWLGFYENAFRMIRACYEELGRPPGAPLATWRDAFRRHSLITLMEEVDGRWIKWPFDFPLNDELPGEGGELLRPWSYVRMLLEWMVATFRRMESRMLAGEPVVTASEGGITGVAGEGVAAVAGAGAVAASTGEVSVASVGGVTATSEEGAVVEVEVGGVAAVAGPGVAAVATGDGTAVVADDPGARVVGAMGAPLHRARDQANALHDDPRAHRVVEHHNILSAIEEFLAAHVHAVEEALWKDDELRRLYILLSLGAATVRGILTDGVLFGGFEAIDGYDLTEWLQRHGATDRDIWWSAPVRAIYDLVFAYEGGDVDRPNLAAGTGLLGVLRMFFTYKGSVYWKMQAGMGDTIFGPLYEVLRRRGVEFRFFHRVDNLGLSPDQSAIETIDLGIQATPKAGEYRPLVDVKGLPCWPSEPLYDQLVEGQELKARGINLESAWTPWRDVARRTLRRGVDFDQVVLGISLGSLPFLCKELIEVDSRWRDMVERVKTVQTQAFQLWLNRDASGLGWVARARGQTGAYVEPLDTWADMSQLLPREDWPASANVLNVSYFCGPMADPRVIPAPGTDPAFPEREDRSVKEEVLKFLGKDIRPLWPLATTPANPNGLDWDLLVDPTGAAGQARLDSQFWRANIDPSERYVLSVKGSTAYRLPADDSGFSNLVLAGDWTYNGIMNAGCVEAAAVSGLQASRALSGYPDAIIGVR